MYVMSILGGQVGGAPQDGFDAAAGQFELPGQALEIYLGGDGSGGRDHGLPQA